jgi:hypothetical protein
VRITVRKKVERKMATSNITAKQIKADARRYLVMTDIAKGMGYTDIIKKYEVEWELSPKTIELILNETIAFMRSDIAKENLISMNMQRLDTIITDSMKDSDRKNAIKAIDTQNKLAGGYTEKVQIEGDTEINLNFEIGE